MLSKKWEGLSSAEKSQYETEANSLYAEYMQEYERVNTLSDELWTRQKTLKAKGDMDTRTAVKRISPYRVYKRETAAQIKSEYPAMSNEERSQIVKERWHTISDKMKAVYVALARLEEEKLAWDAMQDFYKERINTMRDHAGMPPVQWPLWKQNNPQNSAVEGAKSVGQIVTVARLSEQDDSSAEHESKPVETKQPKQPPEVQKKSGKSTTPSGSEQDNSDEVCKKARRAIRASPRRLSTLYLLRRMPLRERSISRTTLTIPENEGKVEFWEEKAIPKLPRLLASLF